MLVEKPAKEGYFIEAFVCADSLIDHALEGLLRQIYEETAAQDLIGHIPKGRLTGRFVAEILKSKGLLKLTSPKGVDGIANVLLSHSRLLKDKDFEPKRKGLETLYCRICKFKEKRNRVAHSIEAEYNLLAWKERKHCETQEQHDTITQKEAKWWLSEALAIFCDLHSLIQMLAKKKGNAVVNADSMKT